MNAISRTFRRVVGLPTGTGRQSRSTSSPARRKRFQLSVEALDQRVMPSLSPINPTAGSGLDGVVEVQATYPDGQTVAGTGAMIDGFHVLTAGHILYSAKDGGYASSVQVIAADSSNYEPFGVAFGTDERVDPSWISYNKANPGATSPTVQDIGLLTLNRSIGNLTGEFVIWYNNSNAWFKGETFQTAGYPTLPGLTAPRCIAGPGRRQARSRPTASASHRPACPHRQGRAAALSGKPLPRERMCSMASLRARVDSRRQAKCMPIASR